MQKLLPLLAFTLGIFLFTTALYAGYEATERAECETWIEQSHTIPGFYFSNWQREQCTTLGYIIPKK